MRPVRLARVLALALLPIGCGDQATPRAERGSAPSHASDDARAHVETFVVVPDYADLATLLRQGHAVARERFGPHRLHYKAVFSTGPAGLDPSEPVPAVAVDEPIHERFTITDELELVWASAAASGSGPPAPPRLSLDQRNEHEHGRALILLDERAWTSLDGRGWLERPVETDLWRMWADDAQHAVLDLVELAGPHAAIESVTPGDLDGRPVVRVSLRQAEQRHPERIVEAPSPWRRGAEVRVIAAAIVLDRATGLWRSATIELAWTFQDSAGRELRGHVRFEGALEVLAEPPVILPPAESAPLPERDRPELLRERLLDGLAGP